MEDDLITTKEVGDYRIKVYYCRDSECPVTNWGLFGSFFFEYSDTHRLHDECNWKTFFYDNKHDLRDVIDAIVMKHIEQKDIVKYLKKGEAGYSKEEFDKVNKESKDPELENINSFNNTVKKANEIKDRVLKYVYNIKQERSYNNDLVGIFERYKDIADGDLEVAMKFIKEAYPFNEETESFIRKKFDMPIPEESKEQ